MKDERYAYLRLEDVFDVIGKGMPVDSDVMLELRFPNMIRSREYSEYEIWTARVMSSVDCTCILPGRNADGKNFQHVVNTWLEYAINDKVLSPDQMPESLDFLQKKDSMDPVRINSACYKLYLATDRDLVDLPDKLVPHYELFKKVFIYSSAPYFPICNFMQFSSVNMARELDPDELDKMVCDFYKAFFREFDSRSAAVGLTESEQMLADAGQALKKGDYSSGISLCTKASRKSPFFQMPYSIKAQLIDGLQKKKGKDYRRKIGKMFRKVLGISHDNSLAIPAFYGLLEKKCDLFIAESMARRHPENAYWQEEYKSVSAK